jgi:hypothetical protein
MVCPMQTCRTARKDVLIAAHRRIEAGAFDPPDPTLPLAENVAAWVSGIARWTAIDSNRSRARYYGLFMVGPTQEHPVDVDAIRVPSPEEQLLAREELEAVGRMKMTATQAKGARAADSAGAHGTGDRGTAGHPRGHCRKLREVGAEGVGEGEVTTVQV